ncbi:flagellar motor stator protein MotA [Enterobacter sp. CC120223-11]|uniref:flagellar motor stator protein MotA n=1 Tax=Enterobacter sp. CC120223-11 TaxID=1378073 RepID=UPI000BCD9E43|nr:flagellar motor stator protein MotA [Enterobacter sp. CC120223-11]SNY67684.1 chemotaxis protein MotA [Enterobacter sp. CC120223-11]
MLVIIGYLVVIATVFGGFVLAGGQLAALFQPIELLIIGGAGVGAFIVGNNAKSLKATGRALVKLFAGKRYNKAVYMDLMALLFLLLSKSRVQGLMSLEKDIEAPLESDIFSAYPRLMNDPMLSNFVLDYFRLMIGGSMNSHEIEALMDEEIETCEEELEVPAHSLNTVGDAFPAFGIVAAVMGVVNALAAADRPAAELGMLIAHAMVGTFLGILIAYGFVLPLATLLRQKSTDQVKILQCIKVTLLSSLNGYAPQVAVEFGRKTIFTSERPSFEELEDHVREVKSSASMKTRNADAA